MFWHAGITALLAAGAQAGGVADLVAEGYLTGRTSRSLESRMMDDVLSMSSVVVSRQLSPNVALNANGTVNMTAWDEQANTACLAALSKLSEATNPSGTCTCYNLPALNNNTGAFEADLRLFQLSAARAEFAGIPADQVQVSLSYRGSSVSPVTATTASQKITARQNKNLKLLQTYMFVGQIDQDKLAVSKANMASLEAFVMPTVTLSAVNAAGLTVSTNVSLNEAVFVAGVFSDNVVLSTTAQAQLAVDQVVAGLANGTVAFVLPGVNLLIFPFGLIVASIWFTIGILVIGFGFFERVQYRESYRRRAAFANKGSVAKRI